MIPVAFSEIVVAPLPTGGTRFRLPTRGDCTLPGTLLFLQVFFGNWLLLVVTAGLPLSLLVTIPLVIAGFVVWCLQCRRLEKEGPHPGHHEGYSEVVVADGELRRVYRWGLFSWRGRRRLSQIRRIVLFSHPGRVKFELVALCEGARPLRLSWGEEYEELHLLGRLLAQTINQLDPARSTPVELVEELRIRDALTEVGVVDGRLRVVSGVWPLRCSWERPVAAVRRVILIRDDWRKRYTLVAACHGLTPLVLLRRSRCGGLLALGEAVARRCNEDRNKEPLEWLRLPVEVSEESNGNLDERPIQPAYSKVTVDENADGITFSVGAATGLGVLIHGRRSLRIDLRDGVLTIDRTSFFGWRTAWRRPGNEIDSIATRTFWVDTSSSENSGGHWQTILSIAAATGPAVTITHLDRKDLEWLGPALRRALELHRPEERAGSEEPLVAPSREAIRCEAVDQIHAGAEQHADVRVHR